MRTGSSQAELLPRDYFHAVVTVLSELRVCSIAITMTVCSAPLSPPAAKLRPLTTACVQLCVPVPYFRHKGGQKCRHAVTPLRQLELRRDGTIYVPYTNDARIEASHAIIRG
jgi:hypothetical protein